MQLKNTSIDPSGGTVTGSGYLVGFFNTIAHRYDLMNTLLSFGLHFSWKREAIRQADIQQQSAVLDLCGGTGDLSILAADELDRRGRAVVYDFSPGMISGCMQKIKGRALREKISLVCGDAEHISAKNESFDVVTIGFGLRNIVNREKALAESFRVLKPAGRFVCLEFSTPVFPPFVVLYSLYSRYVIPFLGSAATGSRAAYCHLVDSIRMFPRPGEIVSLIEQAGFEQVGFKRLSLGVAAIHTGVKPG